ncbi:MAG TPA: hypothetical protein VEL47_05540, partial [Myxococcota bacterium]|nr:hypothetical protein [Myxococcota bacterium]
KYTMLFRILLLTGFLASQPGISMLILDEGQNEEDARKIPLLNNGRIKYEALKEILSEALFRNDLSQIAIVYVIARTRESLLKDAAVASGIVLVTLPLSTYLSVATHRYRQLKRKAKDRLSLQVSPSVFKALRSCWIPYVSKFDPNGINKLMRRDISDGTRSH